jgi:hypothetical protein
MNLNDSKKKVALYGTLCLLAFAAVGCAPTFTTVSTPSAGTIPAKDAVPLKVSAEAGIPLAAPAAAVAAVPTAGAAGAVPGAGATAGAPAAPAGPDIFTLARASSFGARSNPFALLGSELAFDRNQTAARIIDETGGFRSDFTPQPDVEEESVKEQVEYPNWRLAGVIVGDAVIALLDMGTRVVEIRPGAPVTETEWICISIDNDSAVLRHRRDVTPKEVTIYLAAQLFGAPAGGGAGAGGPQGGGFGPPAGGGRPGGDGSPTDGGGSLDR